MIDSGRESMSIQARLSFRNSTFGPREIDADLQTAIAEDYSQYGVLRDAVGELEAREEPHARRRRSGWASASTCWAGIARRSKRCSSADGGALAHFYLGKSQFALGKYAEAIKAYDIGRRRRLQRRRLCARPRPKR